MLASFSMTPTLIGLEQKDKHDFLYWESHENGSKQAARKDQWKAVRPSPGKALELYDLSRDPAETTNVAVQNPKVIQEFETYLRTARTRRRSGTGRLEGRPLGRSETGPPALGL